MSDLTLGEMGLVTGDVLRLVDRNDKPYGPFWRVVSIDRDPSTEEFMHYPIHVVSAADHNGLRDDEPFYVQWHSGHSGRGKVTRADVEELKRTRTPIWDEILREDAE